MPDIDTLELLAPLSLDELYASRAGAGTQLTANQDTLKRALAASVLFCQRYTRRSFVPEGGDEESTDTVVQVVVVESTSPTIRVRDVRQLTGVTIDGDAADVDLVTLLPLDGDDAPRAGSTYGLPAPRLTLPTTGARIVLTGKFGFLEVPADVRDAIYTDAIRRSKDQDAGFADRVELGDGTVMSYFRTMPARVQATYNSLRVQADFLGAS